MDIDTNPAAPPGFGQLQTIIGWASWSATIICVLVVLAFGALMTISVSRHGESTKGVGKIIGGGLIIGAASSIVGTLTGYSLFNSNPAIIPGLTQIQNIVKWSAFVALGLCVLGAIICGIKLLASFREGNNEGVKNFGAVVGGCLIVGSASTIVGLLI